MVVDFEFLLTGRFPRKCSVVSVMTFDVNRQRAINENETELVVIFFEISLTDVNILCLMRVEVMNSIPIFDAAVINNFS